LLRCARNDEINPSFQEVRDQVAQVQMLAGLLEVLGQGVDGTILG
jgi:hypothetical protein